MKSKILISALVLASLLSACSKTNSNSPATLYVIVNNGNHFSGSYYNLINVAYGSTAIDQDLEPATGSLDTLKPTNVSKNTGLVSGVAYTIAVESYITGAGGNPVAPVYNGSTTVTLSAGETRYVTVTPQ